MPSSRNLAGALSRKSCRQGGRPFLGSTRLVLRGAPSRWPSPIERESANPNGWVFFDRGLIDAAAALQHLTGEPVLLPLGQSHRYQRCVFLVPPWPEIYVTDRERRHDLGAALPEYWRLLEVYPSLGYEISILPKIGVLKRVDLVLSRLKE